MFHYATHGPALNVAFDARHEMLGLENEESDEITPVHEFLSRRSVLYTTASGFVNSEVTRVTAERQYLFHRRDVLEGDATTGADDEVRTVGGELRLLRLEDKKFALDAAEGDGSHDIDL